MVGTDSNLIVVYSVLSWSFRLFTIEWTLDCLWNHKLEHLGNPAPIRPVSRKTISHQQQFKAIPDRNPPTGKGKNHHSSGVEDTPKRIQGTFQIALRRLGVCGSCSTMEPQKPKCAGMTNKWEHFFVIRCCVRDWILIRLRILLVDLDTRLNFKLGTFNWKVAFERYLVVRFRYLIWTNLYLHRFVTWKTCWDWN